MLAIVALVLAAHLAAGAPPAPHDCCYDRRVDGTGFHRTLVTTVHTATSAAFCGVTSIEEQLPRNVYVDVYQLRNEEPWGGPIVAVRSPTDRRIDVEAPASAEAATPIALGVRSSSSEIGMPFHVRYQDTSDGGVFASFVIPAPSSVRVLLCDDDVGLLVCAPCGEAGQDVAVSVPVGHKEHAVLVTSGTLALTLVGAIVLSLVVLYSGSKPK